MEEEHFSASFASDDPPSEQINLSASTVKMSRFDGRHATLFEIDPIRIIGLKFKCKTNSSGINLLVNHVTLFVRTPTL